MPDPIPNAAQIRAALGLLKWENETLARLCQITPQSVSNIKRGETRPQPRILSSIRRVFEANGVEFTDNSGTRLRPEGVEILLEDGGFKKFYDILYDTLAREGGEVCVSNVDERLFARHQKEFGAAYMDKMARLVRSRRDVKMKILVREGDTHFTAAAYATYRWQNPESFTPTAFYVFPNHLALISFEGDNAPRVVLIKSAVFSAAYRQQFMAHWRAARRPG